MHRVMFRICIAIVTTAFLIIGLTIFYCGHQTEGRSLGFVGGASRQSPVLDRLCLPSRRVLEKDIQIVYGLANRGDFSEVAMSMLAPQESDHCKPGVPLCHI